MLFTTHSIVGAAVGAATGNPYWGFAAGVVSHHAIDALPHFDQGSFYTKKSGPQYLGLKGEYTAHSGFCQRDWIILFIDFAVGGALLLAIFLAEPQRWPLVTLGAFGGLLPDLIGSNPLLSGWIHKQSAILRKYRDFHSYFHWTAAYNEIPLGLFTQVFLVAACLIYLL